MRIGFEPHHHIGVVDHLLRDVAVQVQSYAQRYTGRSRPHAGKQVALPVRCVLRHHGAMQIKQDGITTRRCGDDEIRQLGIGVGVYRSTGVRHSGDWRHALRPYPLCCINESRHRRSHAVVGMEGRHVVLGRKRL